MRLNGPLLLACLLAMALSSCIFSEDDRLTELLQPVAALPTQFSGVLPGAKGDTSEDSLTIRFRADSGATLEFEWLYSESPVDVSLKSGDDKGNPYYSSYQSVTSEPYWVRFGDTITITFPVLRTGEYLLNLKGKAASQYLLKLTRRAGLDPWIAPPDRWEPDSIADQATLLEGSWQIHSVGAGLQGDVDWFRFPVDSGRTYFVEKVDSSGGNTLPGDLYLEDGARWGGPMATVHTSGQLLFRVHGYAGPGGVYKLRLKSWSTGSSEDALMDSCERGDLVAGCLLVERDTLVSAISYPGDVDLYRMAVDSGRTYTIRMRYPGLGMDFDLIRDSIALRPTGIRIEEEGLEASVSYAAGRTDTLVFALKGDSLTKYGLSLTSVQGIPDSTVLDAYELDGHPDRAKFLELDSTIQVRTLHGGMVRPDTDYVALACDSGKTYSLQFKYLEGSAPEILIQDRFGAVQGVSGLTGKTGRLVTFPCVRSGTYFLRVNGWGWEWARYAVAGVAKDSLPDWALPEPNEPDGPQSAALLVDGGMLEQRITHRDTDWVRLPVTKGRRYVLTLTNLGTSGNPVVSMKTESGVPFGMFWMSAHRGSLPARDSIEVTADGENLFRIELDGGEYGVVAPYRLSVVSYPLPGDSLEPDSSQDLAPAIALGKGFLKRWANTADTDWVVFEVNKGQLFSLFLRNEGAQPAASLFFEDLVPIVGVESGNGGASVEKYEWLPTRTGKVWACITSPIANTMPYSLRAEQMPVNVLVKGKTMANPFLANVDSVPMLSLITGQVWYRIPVTAGKSYSIRVEGDGIYDVERFDSAGSSLVYYGGRLMSYSQTETFQSAVDGTQYLKVTPPSGWPGDQYWVRVWIAQLE